MAIVETEQHGQIFVIRMNRPERLNAMGKELREQLAQQWAMFRQNPDLEVAIFTGTGRGLRRRRYERISCRRSPRR